MGIGLSISKSIIEAHGGEIFAEPNPGGGTRFCVRLPPAPPPGEGWNKGDTILN
jgi:two-component system sensor kinase FixL